MLQMISYWLTFNVTQFLSLCSFLATILRLFKFLLFPHQIRQSFCLPWLKLHTTLIDWSLLSIVNWSVFCHSHCLKWELWYSGTLTPSSPPAPPDLSSVPLFAYYHDLGEMFSKQCALTLPPHKLHDCSIDLLHGSWLPASRLYNLSHLKKRGHGEIFCS